MQSAKIESHQSMRSVDSVGRSRMRFLRLFASFLLSIGAGHLSCAAAELPKTMELAENWKLTSANKLQQGGAAVSLPDFKDADWNAKPPQAPPPRSCSLQLRDECAPT